jgi:hypothetical protein
MKLTVNPRVDFPSEVHIATHVGHSYDSQVNYLRFDQTLVISASGEAGARVRYAPSRSARSGPSQGS